MNSAYGIDRFVKQLVKNEKFKWHASGKRGPFEVNSVYGIDRFLKHLFYVYIIGSFVVIKE